MARQKKALEAGNYEILTEQIYFNLAKETGLLRSDIPPQKDKVLIPCTIHFGDTKYTLKTGKWPIGEKGFSFDDNTIALVKTVDPDSLAYKAGIRVGQTVLRHISGSENDIISPYTLLLKGLDGTVRQVSYFPRGPIGNTPYSQYVNDNISTYGWADVNDAAHCRL